MVLMAAEHIQLALQRWEQRASEGRMFKWLFQIVRLNRYYYYSNHSGMGGTANIVEPVTVYNHEQGLNYDNGSVFCETVRESGKWRSDSCVTQVIPMKATG